MRRSVGVCGAGGEASGTLARRCRCGARALDRRPDRAAPGPAAALDRRASRPQPRRRPRGRPHDRSSRRGLRTLDRDAGADGSAGAAVERREVACATGAGRESGAATPETGGRARAGRDRRGGRAGLELASMDDLGGAWSSGRRRALARAEPGRRSRRRLSAWRRDVGGLGQSLLQREHLHQRQSGRDLEPRRCGDRRLLVRARLGLPHAGPLRRRRGRTLARRGIRVRSLHHTRTLVRRPGRERRGAPAARRSACSPRSGRSC